MGTKVRQLGAVRNVNLQRQPVARSGVAAGFISRRFGDDDKREISKPRIDIVEARESLQ